MLTVAHVGGGGVKSIQNHAHVINGRSYGKAEETWYNGNNFNAIKGNFLF